ncbi:MAG TPA: TetR/AcrR family transcriptional regulator [Ktedonobacteraceae bacterium]|nr:TetR/AcrR family transcriptional regulator [Ktedonobacteraceae bacterium]
MTNHTVTSRRTELLNAAREVFAEKGFEGTRISEIVARVGVAQGTFYLYFPSKVSLVFALAELMQKKIEAAIAEACTVYPYQAIERSVQSAFDIMEEYRDVLGVIHSSACWVEAPEAHEHLLSSCYGLIAKLIRHEQERGRIDARINADITAVLIAGVVYYAADECYLYNSSAQPEAYIKETVSFIKRALGITL